MGRRALRPIDPSLDLSFHLGELSDLPQPVDWQQKFQRIAPVEVEVGTGKGLFLQRASASQSEHDFVGIEVAAKYARFAAARLAKAKQPNATILRGDANQLFQEHLRPESIAAVHIYFPDPWWKERHIKRRIMNATFLPLVERVLGPGGKLHFWTDVEEYYRLSLDTLAAATRLRGPLSVAEREAAHDMDYHTHFERRTRLHNRPVFRSMFEK